MYYYHDTLLLGKKTELLQEMNSVQNIYNNKNKKANNNNDKNMNQNEYINNEEEVLKLYSKQSWKEIELLGSILTPPKISEILLTDPEVLNMLNLKRTELDKEQKIGREAIRLLSILPSYEDNTKRKGNATTTPKAIIPSEKEAEKIVERLKEHGIVIYNNVIEGEINLIASNKIFDKLHLVDNDDENDNDIDDYIGKTINRLPCKIDIDSAKVLHSLMSFTNPILENTVGKDSSLVELNVINAVNNKKATTTSYKMEPSHECYGDEEDKIYANPKVYSILYFPEGVDDQHTKMTFEFQPGTMTYAHFLEDEEKDLLKPIPIVQTHVPKGSLVLLDNCVFHRIGLFARNNDDDYNRSSNSSNNSSSIHSNDGDENPLRIFVLSFKATTSLPIGVEEPVNKRVIMKEYLKQKIVLSDLSTSSKTPKDILLKFS